MARRAHVHSLVSVIIPTYNRADMLDEALTSVFDQTYRDLEIIVVDDGSTDHTSRVIDKYGGRVTYIVQENQGPSQARNAGIRASHGPYIAFLDDDDIWLPSKVALQVRALEENPDVSLVYGSAYVTQGEARSLVFTEGPPTRERLLEWLIAYKFRSNPTVVMIRRDVLNESGLFDPKLEACEEWDLWLRIAQCGGKFAHVGGPIAEYRLHGNNMVFDFRRMDAGLIAVAEKFFSALETPANLKAKRAHYLSRVLVRVGMDHYIAAELMQAWKAWGEAVTLDPSVLTPRLLSLMGKSLLGPRMLLWSRWIRDRLMPTAHARSK